MTWGGDGSPHLRGQRRGETMDSRPCLHGQALRGGNEVGRRWVPASARTTEGRDDGFPPLSSWAGSARGQRSGEEDGSPHPRGQRRGERMGSRLRGNNGGGARLCAGATKWGGDGSPHPRGQRRGERMGSRLRGNNGGGARLCAGATEWGGDGFPPPREQRRGGRR